MRSQDAAGRVEIAGAKQRAQALDLIRAAAAMLVLTYHVWLYLLPNPSSPSREGFLDHAFWELRVGLVIFFVLSGYLLYKPLLGQDGRPRSVPTGDYFRRRAARILPAYYLAVAGSVALLWSLGDTPGVRLPEAENLWLFAFFLQNYSRDTLLTLDPPTWTLAVQVAFYAVFPLMLFAARRFGRRAWMMPVALIAIGLLYNWITYNNHDGPIARLSLLSFLPVLAVGMLAAHAPPLRSARAAWWSIGAGLVLAVGNSVWHALGVTPGLIGVLRDDLGAVGYALIIVGAASPLIGSLGRLRPVEAFGRWSYGVFLWHLPLFLFMKGSGLLPGSGVLSWALLVAVASAAGAVTWRLIELPMLERTRGARSPGTLSVDDRRSPDA